MKNVIITLAFLLGIAFSVQSQDNKAYESAMVKMLEVSKSMEAMKQIAPQITAMMKQQSGGQISDEFSKLMETEFVKMYDRMIKAMIPVYQRYLSLEDIHGVIAFYETPVGKKLADSNIKIAVDIMPIAQQIGMETMQTLMQTAKEKGYIK